MRTISHRYLKIAAVILVAVGIAYWASPYISAIRFAQAARSGDVQDVLSRTDAERVRASFARQIVRAYASTDSGFLALPTEARVGVSLAASAFVEAMLAQHLTAEAVAQALSGKRQQSDRKVELPSIAGMGNAWEVFTASGFIRPAAFAVDIPKTEVGPIRLLFGFFGANWKLTSVQLPDASMRQVIDELRAQVKTSSG
jgi:hypothetical protein